MNPDQLILWQRIQAHVLDDPKSAAPFSLRLAAENGWKPGFTDRAIEEYRRFAFLAAASGHPVSPPDVIDQVWHLHLLYTRDYWGEFCPNTLGMALHHGPARGGAAEADKFTDWYAKTLASYRRFFGEPPTEIWPERPMHPRAMRVDTGRNWVVPKPRLTRFAGWFNRPAAHDKAATTHLSSVQPERPALLSAAWVALAAVQTPAHEWPFDLRGPQFLLFFVVFGIGLFFLARWLRRWLQGPDEPSDIDALSPYEVAHLAGGPQRVFVAALATSAQQRLVLVGKDAVVRTQTPMPPGLPIVERAICAAARETGSTLKSVREATAGALASVKAALGERGFLLEETKLTIARFAPGAVIALGTIIGIQKISIGMALGRPVAFLVILTVVSGLVALGFMLRPPRLTGRGRAALRQLEERHTRIAHLSQPQVQAPEGLLLIPLAVGLFGVTALHGTELENVAKHGVPRAGDGGSGGCGSGCSTGGCSGGGGGGGGGGCGGCGGGD
ncbi:MAG: TIGR04222 domain-containing membrane protein [Verrucomicrobiota bacterium]